MNIPFRTAFRYWLRLGFVNFGGPAGQIAIMHRELVDEKGWISEERFLHALNYCMFLPGPEAQQLAIYVGWLLHGTRGGIVAGAFFVIPSIFILLALTWMYVAYGSVAWVQGIFYGLKPAVMAIVAEAVIRIGRRALKHWTLVSVAAVAFVLIYFLDVSFPWIIAGAAAVGYLVQRPQQQGTQNFEKTPGTLDYFDWARAVKITSTCLVLWVTPLLLLGLWGGWDDILFQEGLFFSKASMVTFGGAYAVLAYIAQVTVVDYGWIAPGQMVDGLALAETTPGPLIMVTQFVGFVAAWQHASGISPLTAGILGGLITTWVTFVPCFLWIFLGAPFIERLRGNQALNAVLSSITAAVVGVILNLAVFFAVHTVFPGRRFDAFAALIGIVAFAGLLRFRWGIVPVILGAAAIGLLWTVAW